MVNISVHVTSNVTCMFENESLSYFALICHNGDHLLSCFSNFVFMIVGVINRMAVYMYLPRCPVMTVCLAKKCFLEKFHHDIKK